MLLFIAVLAKSFSYLGQMLMEPSDLSPDSRFMVWALGASLFAHAATFVSVSYFDQSFVFIYLTLAAIGSARALAKNSAPCVSSLVRTRNAYRPALHLMEQRGRIR